MTYTEPVYSQLMQYDEFRRLCSFHSMHCMMYKYMPRIYSVIFVNKNENG